MERVDEAMLQCALEEVEADDEVKTAIAHYKTHEPDNIQSFADFQAELAKDGLR